MLGKGQLDDEEMDSIGRLPHEFVQALGTGLGFCGIGLQDVVLRAQDLFSYYIPPTLFYVLKHCI